MAESSADQCSNLSFLIHVADLASVAAALDALHAMGPGTAVISSCTLKDTHSLAVLAKAVNSKKEGTDEELAETMKNKMFVFGREADGKMFFIPVDVIPGYFSGTGDLFSALLLAWMIKGDSAAVACEKTVAAINGVLQRTKAAHSFELLLIQSRKDIEYPQIEDFRAISFPSL